MPEGKSLAFTSGMFCEIGQLVLDLCLPQHFSSILQHQASSNLSLLELEESELGFNHFDIGADVIHLWNFPSEIELLVRHWNKPELQIEYDPLACIVHIAVSIENGMKGEEQLKNLCAIWCSNKPLRWEQIEASLPSKEELEDLYRYDS